MLLATWIAIENDDVINCHLLCYLMFLVSFSHACSSSEGQWDSRDCLAAVSDPSCGAVLSCAYHTGGQHLVLAAGEQECLSSILWSGSCLSKDVFWKREQRKVVPRICMMSMGCLKHFPKWPQLHADTVSVAIVSILAWVQEKEDYIGKYEPCTETFLFCFVLFSLA